MESNMFIEGPELCVFRLCGFVPISCGSPLSCTGLVIVCQSSRPNCTHNPSTWNEAVLDDSASSLPSIKTSCFFDHSPLYILMNIYIYILGTSDLGLVKDTLGWTSPISSCFRPPLHKSQLIRCPYEIRNYAWFFCAAWTTRKTRMT